MLQRQIMFKQLEELQRQKKLQELNDSRQHNVINQQSLLHNKQTQGAQYAPLINGTPVRDASQMFMFGNNTNLVQGFQNGLPYSQQAQNQVLHSMGLGSQPVDGHSLSRFSHFQWATRESTGEQVETISRSSMSDQVNVSCQERNIMGGQTGNDQQEFGCGQEQDFTSLDPLEQKFLFNTDDDSLGGFGNMFEDTDSSQAFPYLQSGSWSALMQSALEETLSTDTGVQEEWSGLSFQNSEHSNDNQPSSLTESGKNPTLWQNNIFQNSRTDARSQVQKISPLPVHLGPSGHAGEFESVNDASINGREFKKIHSKASDDTIFRSSNSSGMSAIVDKSAGFPVLDSNAQTCHHMLELLQKVETFRDYKHGTQSAYINSAPTNEMPKVETADAFTLLNNSSASHHFGLRLAPPTRSPPMNYFDLSQISRQTDTTHVVPLKEQDGQRSLVFEGQQVSDSTRQPNLWVDIPSRQNLSGMGFHKAPSGSPSNSDVANSRMETASEAPKESDSHMFVKGHVLGFDYTRGQEGKIGFEKESFSGRVEANVSSSSLVHGSGNPAHIFPHGYSPLNPTYSDPSIRATLKNEKVDSDIKVPQLTSMSQLTSVYENYKNLLVSSAAREDQLVKNQSHTPLQDTSQPYRNSSFAQMNLANTSHYGSLMPVTGTNSFAINQFFSRYSQHLDMPNQDLLASQSKKRKFLTFELLPWHKEATKGSSRLQDISIAELEWAQAANRVPEKLKEEGEAVGDSPWMVHPKKRIIFTTKLMQVLFRPAPAANLTDDDDSSACINSLTYFAARLALGDACSLANHSHKPCDISDSSSEKDVISKGSGDQNLSKIVEDFIDRAKTLEDNLLRLESGGSVLEIRMEAQDLERFSVINRFAKFHSRAQMVANETTSSGGASSVPKLYPQRYVTASPMPWIVPYGHTCLSL